MQLPATLSLDLYQVWVEDQGQSSPIAYVNQPQGMHFDSPEVKPGGPLRLYGRNLQLSGSAAQVRFQAHNGSGMAMATVQAGQSDAYSLSLTAPAGLVPGVVYDVYVSNGRNNSETLVERSITAIASGDDYFQLGVGWAAKLNFTNNVYNVKTDSRLSQHAVGNGVEDDKPAIQEAIDMAGAAGGGIVYLPEGTYKLVYSGWGGFAMRNRVVVQGAGKDRTFVKFGYDNPGYSAAGQAVHFDDQAYQSGLADLAMINVDNSGRWIMNLWGQQSRELLFQRIRFDLNTGEWLMLRDANKLFIGNSDISQGMNPGLRGPMLLDGSANLVLRNNSVTFATRGLNLQFVTDAVVENNRIYRDGNARYPTWFTNHVLIVDFAYNLVVKGNLFKLINGPAQNSNDGETIIAEGGGPNRFDEETGTVSSASPTTLQDNAKSWGAMSLHPVVAIVNGPGMGQWRTIASRGGNTLALDRAWDVVPTAASRYAIFNWGSRNWLLQSNTLEGHQRGITLYGNATTNVAIVDNTLTNSGSIDLSPWQQDQPVPGVAQDFLPMYNNQIIGNRVANTNGANGVFIGVHTVQPIQNRTFGTSVIGLEVRRNSLTAGQPNTPALVDSSYPEGYLNYLDYQTGAASYFDEQIPAVLGSIFQDNTAINTERALYLNTGSYNTLVCNTTLVNAKQLILDTRFSNVTHSSVGTVTCLAPTTAGLRAPENPANTTAGLDYKLYEGFWEYLPDLSQLTPVKTGTTTDFELSMRQRDYGYLVSYSGYVTVPADGQYSFILNSDDGSQLYIGSTLVVDNNQLGENERTGTIGLQAGTHAITVTYLQRGGSQILSVGYFGPGLTKQQIPVTALRRGGLLAAIPATTPTTIPAPTPAPAASFYRAVNINGPAITLDGNAWEASTAANFSFTGNTYQNQQVPLVPATDDVRANMVRSFLWGGDNWGVTPSLAMSALPSGTYDVYLYVWEDNYAETFDVKVENVTVLSNYNSGSAGTWKKLGPWRTTVSDGVLNVSTQGGAANVSGLEVWRAAATSLVGDAPASAKAHTSALESSAAAISSSPADDKLVLHPNPSSAQVFLETNNNDWTHVAVYDSYGALHISQDRSPESVTINVSSLSTGIYVVEVRLATGQVLRSRLTVAH